MKKNVIEIQNAIRHSELGPEELRSELDAMDWPEQREFVRTIAGKSQRLMWELCNGKGTSLNDLIPDYVPPGVEVIHYGGSLLPALKWSQKRFCRPIERFQENSPVLYGYNEGTTRRLVGPGFFVAEYFPSREEAGINYYRIPPQRVQLPPGWPERRSNEWGLQRLVYSKTIDYLRQVATRICIGRVYKQDHATNSYFVLFRDVA
ncbi:MAG: hypothetical protein VYA34_06630 [Myxococcota bacterium]|nr:hypothetical protein [Myxococcota bacterium]